MEAALSSRSSDTALPADDATIVLVLLFLVYLVGVGIGSLGVNLGDGQTRKHLLSEDTTDDTKTGETN
jgi:hypothetical protein